MGTQLNRYLVLQGNIRFRTAKLHNFLKLLARKRLGTRWATAIFHTKNRQTNNL